MRLQHVAAALLRSITPATGAIIVAVVAGASELAFEFALYSFGRPLTYESSWFYVHFLPFVGVVVFFAVIGAVLGLIVRTAVRFTRWAGPVDRRVVSVLLVLAFVVPSWLTVRSFLREEAFHTPRVIETTGQIVRSDRPSDLNPPLEDPLLWYWIEGELTHGLLWNGRAVSLASTREGPPRVMPTGFEVRAGDLSTIDIDVQGFDDPTRVWGVTAALNGGDPESLVLLVGMHNGLRESDHRALLLIFDPQGTMIYEELLRMESDAAQLWTVGTKPESQDILVDVGTPVRYTSAR